MNRKQNSLMRFSRTERLAQLSEQEIVIERKKREIQAKLEAQKKKQTEEAFKKLESSKETKNHKPGFSRKSPGRGTEYEKNSSKEKPVEQVKESLTNAFSNDGSFLDQFKKLSQTGLAPNYANMRTLANAKKVTGDLKRNQDTNEEVIKTPESERDMTDSKPGNNNSQSFPAKEPQDSEIQLQMSPPGVVNLTPLQFQNSTQSQLIAFNSDSTKLISSQSTTQPVSQVQSSQFCTVFNSKNPDNFSNKKDQDNLSTTTLSSVQLPLTSPKNTPSTSLLQAQNTLPSNISSSELPKVRSESISMTLKCNTVKKLEAIPNPLDFDEAPSPPSQTENQCSLKETRHSLSTVHFNTTSILENVASRNRESSGISSAFYNNDEDKEENYDHLDENFHHSAELVAKFGDDFEDSLRSRKNDPNVRFLMDKNSKEYLLFRKLVQKYRRRLNLSEQGSSEKQQVSRGDNSNTKVFGSERIISARQEDTKMHSRSCGNQEDDGPLPYENQFQAKDVEKSTESSQDRAQSSEETKTEERRKRKRKSRWGDAVPTTSTPTTSSLSLQPPGKLPAPKSALLSQLTRSDPGLIQYARQTFGSTNLSEEDWKKAEDHYKVSIVVFQINLLYQDMVKKRAEVEKLERQGKFKYEYDSDEDTEGGTWEHKLRKQEMQATQLWAEELTRQAAGKHHIGDFLPPEELERFMEKYNAVKEGREPDLSDYKEYKLKQDNVGYRLLQKMGWNEGQGLGQDGTGITNPVNKATTRHENQGLGIERPDGLTPGDDEYDAYRKRMMLAYRFRPNPLNNPRRPYY